MDFYPPLVDPHFIHGTGGVVPSLGYIFMRIQIYGHGFQQFLHFPDLWVWFLQSSLSFFSISGFMGILFRSFSDLWVVMNDVNGTTPHIGNSSDLPASPSPFHGLSPLIGPRPQIMWSQNYSKSPRVRTYFFVSQAEIGLKTGTPQYNA